jgi:hypothetical protein
MKLCRYFAGLFAQCITKKFSIGGSPPSKLLTVIGAMAIQRQVKNRPANSAG